MSLGTVGYGAAAVVFLLLTLLLWVSWRGRPLGGRFIFASVMTALWAILLALHAWGGHMPFFAIYFVELMRSGAWLAVLLGIAGTATPGPFKIGVAVLWAALLSGGLAWPFIRDRGIEPAEAELLVSRSGLALTLCGLVLLEQIYRNAGAAARHGLRYLAIGVGGLFVYDLFLFSQAELLRQISADAWNARGIVNALLVPAIAVAVRRNPEWSLDIFVSRHVLFYTGTIVGVGIYLLTMAIGGYYVRAFGGHWGGVAQIVFFVGAAAVLVSLIFSGNLRGRFKVFLNKHFYRNKYDYRVEWLRFIQTLESMEEGGVGRTALRAVAQIFESPGGILFIADESGRWFVASAAWPDDFVLSAQSGGTALGARLRGNEVISADHELLRFLRSSQWIIDLREYARSPDIYQNIELPDWLRADRRLRIVSPLLQLDRLLGFVVLYDPPPPFKLTYEDRDLLQTVGRHVATQIAQHQADQKLAESRQFEAYNKLTAFIMHDLKNSVAQLKLLVENAERHKHNPDFIDDAIGTIANTVERITKLIEQVRGKEVQGTARSVDIVELVGAAVNRCAGRKPVPLLETETLSSADNRDAKQFPMQGLTVQADPDKLAAVIEHVIRNAQDATPESGSVSVRLQAGEGSALIEVHDTGCGMEPQFVRDRLFRPFDSTKGSKGMGIGAYQVREYVRALGGEVEVQSTTGRGTRFSIRLPL